MVSNFLNSIGIDIGVVVIVLFIVLVIQFILTIGMMMRFKRFNRKYRQFMRGKDGTSLEKSFMKSFHELDMLIESNKNHREEIKNIKETLNISLHKRAIIKYDAFHDVGGKLSFVLAMLDDNNSGFVVNAIHSREGCYTYIKEIVKGESFIALGKEEMEALRQAANMDE